MALVSAADPPGGESGGGCPGGSLATMADDLGSRYSVMSRDKTLKPKEREAAMLFAVAEGHLNEEEDMEALEVGREALALWRELKDEHGIADTLRIIIHVYVYQDNRKEANRLAREELDRIRHSNDRKGEAKILLSIAEVNSEKRGQKNRDEALMFATEAQALFHEQGEKKMEAYAMLVLFNVQMKTRGNKRKLTEEALNVATEARGLFTDIGDKRGEATALHAIAVAHVRAKLHGFTLSTGGWVTPAKESLAIFKELKLKKLEAFTRTSIAQFYLIENPRKALKAAEEALAYCREVGSGQEPAALGVVVQAHLNIKDTSKAWMLKEANLAVKKAKQGLARFQAAGDKFAEGYAMNALVLALIAKEEPQEALRVADEACEIYRSMGDRTSETQMLQLMSQLHLKRSQTDKAKTAAQGITSISQNVNEQAIALETVYEVHLQKRDFQNAISTAMEIQKLYENKGDKKREAIAMLLIVNVHYMQGDFMEAVTIAREAQAILHDIGTGADEANALRVIAEIHATNHEVEAALRAAERARKLAEEDEHEEGLAPILFLCAQLRLLLLAQAGDLGGKTATFEQGWTEALQAAEEAVAIARKLHNLGLTAAALCTLAQVLMANLKIEAATKATDEAMIIFRESNDERNMASVMCIEADLLIVSGQANKAVNLVNKALAIFRQHRDTRGEWVAMGVMEHIMGPEEDEEEDEDEQWTGEDWKQWAQNQQGGQAGGETAVAMPKRKARVDTGQKLSVGNMKEEVVRSRLAEIVKVTVDMDDEEELDLDTPLMQVGITSKTAVSLRNALTEELPGVNMPFTLVFDYPSINAMSDLIMEQSGTQQLTRG